MVSAGRCTPWSSRFRRLNGTYTVAVVVSLQERSATERVQEARERYVARGISTPPLVVAKAEGALTCCSLIFRS